MVARLRQRGWKNHGKSVVRGGAAVAGMSESFSVYQRGAPSETAASILQAT